jgi:hypothetical protein
MGREGRGDAEIITSVMKKDEVDSATKRFYEHLRSPLLTDISLDFGTLPVSDVYPSHIADLFSGRPVLVTGRYARGTKGVVTLRAKRAGDAYVREIPVEFATSNSVNSVLPSLWARAKIEDLMSQDLAGLQQQKMNSALQKQITDLGLNYRLMTQFTSFVAVEEQVRVEGGKPRTVQVPVELPEGVQYEEQWGNRDRFATTLMATQSVMVSSGTVSHKKAFAPPPPPPPMNGAASGGVGSGSGGGIGAVHGTGVVPGSGGGGGGGAYRVGSVTHAEPLETTKQPSQGLTYTSKDEALLATKSDAKLLAAYQCWSRLTEKSTTDSACKVKNGLVKVDLILSGEWSSLAALGLAPEGHAIRNRLRGTIAIEKLPALAALKEVRFMSLHE